MLDFLQQPAGFDIGETGWLIYDAGQPLWRAFAVGLFNTLRAALPALLWATALGTLLAMARLSPASTWRRLSKLFIEAHRNTPLLLQLLIWYFLLVELLPDPGEAWRLWGGAWLSKGGLAIPWWGLTDTGHWAWSWPEQGAFNVSGGASLTPEFLALWLALSHYTAAFLAEVIRGGLESEIGRAHV